MGLKIGGVYLVILGLLSIIMLIVWSLFILNIAIELSYFFLMDEIYYSIGPGIIFGIIGGIFTTIGGFFTLLAKD